MQYLRWLCLFALVVGCGFSKTLTFTQADLQAKLSKEFPIKKEKYHLTIQLSNPEIRLVEGSDHIGFEVTAAIAYPAVKLLGKTLVKEGTVDGGRFGVVGEVVYDGENKQLYLTNARIQSFSVSQLPEKYQENVRLATQEVLNATLIRVPIYTLKDGTLKQKATRLLLQDVLVKDGLLHVKVGLR